jgi:hypothetical protein
MSYRSKTTYKSTISSDFSGSTNKWTGTEVQNGFTDLADSVMWIDGLATISYASSFTYDCSSSSLQKITLTGNATMTISNVVAGAYYTLEVFQDATGGRTLTLPSGKTNGGTINTTASGISLITFMYDGTYYFFSIGQYA